MLPVHGWGNAIINFRRALRERTPPPPPTAGGACLPRALRWPRNNQPLPHVSSGAWLLHLCTTRISLFIPSFTGGALSSGTGAVTPAYGRGSVFSIPGGSRPKGTEPITGTPQQNQAENIGLLRVGPGFLKRLGSFTY